MRGLGSLCLHCLFLPTRNSAKWHMVDGIVSLEVRDLDMSELLFSALVLEQIPRRYIKTYGVFSYIFRADETGTMTVFQASSTNTVHSNPGSRQLAVTNQEELLPSARVGMSLINTP